MKKVFIYFIALIVPVSAYGGLNEKQNYSHELQIDTHRLKKEELAGRLLELLGLQQILDDRIQMIDSWVRETIENSWDDNNNEIENIHELKQQLRQIYLDEFSWVNFEKDYIKIYADAYDEQELLELIEFYNSPLGKKSIEKQRYVTKAINSRIIERQKKLMLKTDKIIEEFALSSALIKANNPLIAGNLYFSRGEFEKAIIEYNKAIDENPHDFNSLNNLAWLLATCPEEKFRDNKRALDLAQKAVQIKPDLHILDTLAKAYVVNGDLKNAIRTLEEIVKTGIEKNIEKKNLLYYQNHLKELKEKRTNFVSQ